MTRLHDKDPSRVALVQGQQVTEGNGINVRRIFPQNGFEILDPFLLLDHLGPAPVPAGDGSKGFPDHPHRGFETVTYVLKGELAHKDSAGHADVIGPGDAQWMTAGGGIVHSEFPGPALVESGGDLHAVQIWVNLAARNKMVPPRYQALKHTQIPRIELPGEAGTATIIGGSLLGEHGPAERLTPVTIAMLEFENDGACLLPLEDQWNTGLYVVDGALAVEGLDHQLITGQMLALGHGHANLALAAGPAGATVLLLTGAPIDESVARAGPFVMNTTAELEQAFDDYRSGKMG